MSAEVLDPASGSRMFYFDRNDGRVLFGDIRSESHTLCDGRALEVDPDVILDFRSLPFDDGAFKVVIFDPPHLTRVGKRGWMFKKYGGLDVTTWREDLRRAFAECFRVLAPSGVLIFKWNETQIPVADVLALTGWDFHQWDHFQRDADEIEAIRAKARERQRRRRKRLAEPDQPTVEET